MHHKSNQNDSKHINFDVLILGKATGTDLSSQAKQHGI